MNISFICDKKEYNFDLPLETTLNYIRKLTSRIFKCESLDILYKGNKIAMKDKEENTLLKDIVTEVDSTIKLKIILNPTLNSTKNQTPSDSNSQAVIFKNLDLGVNDINEKSNKVILINKDNLRNKLFEALYPQKTRKLNSALKEFNLKILEINNFLFKQKGGIRNDNLTTFEKKIYEFIDNFIIYIRKLISILEMNNFVTYKEMIQNLNLLYPELCTFTRNNTMVVDDINLRTLRETERNDQSNNLYTPINKFPMNLKKSDKHYTINTDRYNYFNKSTKRPSLKKILLLDNNNNHTLDLKSLNIKGIKKNNDDKSDIKKKKENDKLIKITNDDKNKNSNKEEEKEKDKDKENKVDDIFDFSSEENKEENNNDNEKDNNQNDNDELNGIFKKTINNISRITSKTYKSNDSNRNILNEEEIKNLNINITSSSSNKANNEKINKDKNKDKNGPKSKESEMEKNANDIKKDKINGNININNNKKFSSIFKDEMKTFKNKINSFNPGFMPKTKQLNIKKTEQNFNSIIHENEFENLTNSSYDVVNTFKEKTKNEVKEEVKIGEEEEEETKSNIKKEEKSSSTFKKDEKTSSTFKKEEKSSSTFKKDDKTNSTIKKEEKTNSTIKEEKEEKSISGKEEDKKAPNNDSKNISKLVKGLNPSNEEKNINFFNMKENKISNTNNNRGINPPIYQMTSTNEGGMIRALSRKTIMRKKKSKTANKYDFLI
jgi:hypothetical protein